MADPKQLPPWYGNVKQPFGKTPVAVWLSIMFAESGGNVTARNQDGEDSVGIFQLNRRGGQGTGYSLEVLNDPALNAAIASKAINAAYAAAYHAMATIPLSELPMADVAIDSGHPGMDVWPETKIPKTRPEMREDPRIRRIVGIYKAIRAVELKGGSDLEMWTAGAVAHGAGADSSGATPMPGIPGQGALPGLLPDVGDMLGIGKLVESIRENKGYIAIFFVAIMMIALGAAAIVFSGKVNG